MSLSILPQSEAARTELEPARGLAFQGVTAAYEGHPVLWDITGTLADRRITAVIGPSGGGKSTLVKVANRSFELAPGATLMTGRVCLDGEDLYAAGTDPRSVRRAVGLIQQRPVAFPMSILENVLFGARFHDLLGAEAPVDYAKRYLERAGLWDEVKDRLKAPAAGLSGGQLQRLCLARTLANRPQLILLDEPTSSLDPISSGKIEDHLRDLKRDMAVVLVTHDLRQARRLADDVVFMTGGRWLEHGSRDGFFSTPKTSEAAAYLAGSHS